YCTMKHDTTKFTPFSLIYGRDTKLPIETIIETYYKEDESFQEALLKRSFEIENILLKQQDEALENIQEAQKLQK
ncbi:6059_t:CDS:1, partial [Dentiscutata erythropus]